MSDTAQGQAAIFQAADDAVVHHLQCWDDSMAREDLWENHPLLLEDEQEQALLLADQLVAAMVAAMIDRIHGRTNLKGR